jgi:predicted nucleotidyltransferase component of viral defense system
MIPRKEIVDIAREKVVSSSIIDKDWVLGHFLDAIYSITELRQKLVFKGGTCLKKCYIPEYRFSEDLDFTSIDKSIKLTQKHLVEITEFLLKRVELQTHIVSLNDLVYNNQLTGYEATIKFWGSEHPRNEAPPPPERWLTKVKVDVILYELMVFPISKKDVIHPYSDKLTDNANQIPCYSLDEVLAEKMRSLIQRSYAAPRDYYDIWFLSKHYSDLNYKSIVEAFHKKLTFKGHTFTGLDQLINPENDKSVKSAWENSLKYQIVGELPDYNSVKSDLKQLFQSIFS